MKKLAIIFTFVMLLTLVSCGGEKIIWDEMVLGEILPEPPAKKGEIYENYADELWLDVYDISVKQFADYIDACKSNGFTVDAEISSYSYDAYNTDGYKLTLVHDEDDSTMNIELQSPMEMSTIQWPTNDAGKLLPVPKSTIGNFSYEHDDNFCVYIGNTTKAEYDEYVNACSEKGFNVDYSKGDDYYYADNADGWSLSLNYNGNNIMSIDIDAPDNYDSKKETSAPSVEDTAPETTAPVPDTTNKGTEPEVTDNKTESNNDNGIDPDFKAAMDSYEKFIDEYVAFMKKYNENPDDWALLADYAIIMGKYSKFVADFEKWEDLDLNDAEFAYYIDVQARVNKKLLEVT